MKKYMILPAEYDLNRGDQALVWTARQVGEDAGYKGDYYMLVDNPELNQQSKKEGFKFLDPILKHPSRKFKDTENVTYGLSLTLKWGIVAIFDLIKSSLFLNRFTRNIFTFLLSESEKETLKEMKEMDVVFVKGGGFIHSSGKITDWYTIYYSLYHVALAQSLKKSVYIMPNSFGPFKAKGVPGLVKKVLSKSSLVTVRESISKEMVDELGVDSVLSSDLGFYLEKSTTDDQTVSNIRKKFPNHKLVALTARPYRFPNSDNPEQKYEEYISSLVEFSQWMFKNNFLPVFVDHTLAIKEHENDSSAIAEITSKLNDNEYAYISNLDYNCRNLKEIYSEVDFVVGTRFHSVIFALAEGTPSMAITYGGNKGQGIMKDIGLPEYAIPMSQTNTKELIEKLISLDANEEEVKIKLFELKTKFNNEYKELVELVKNN